jgi:hypothetical protein
MNRAFAFGSISTRRRQGPAPRQHHDTAGPACANVDELLDGRMARAGFNATYVSREGAHRPGDRVALSPVADPARRGCIVMFETLPADLRAGRTPRCRASQGGERSPENRRSSRSAGRGAGRPSETMSGDDVDPAAALLRAALAATLASFRRGWAAIRAASGHPPHRGETMRRLAASGVRLTVRSDDLDRRKGRYGWLPWLRKRNSYLAPVSPRNPAGREFVEHLPRGDRALTLPEPLPRRSCHLPLLRSTRTIDRCNAGCSERTVFAAPATPTDDREVPWRGACAAACSGAGSTAPP